jgi:hypothetical protein
MPELRGGLSLFVVVYSRIGLGRLFVDVRGYVYSNPWFDIATLMLATFALRQIYFLVVGTDMARGSGHGF